MTKPSTMMAVAAGFLHTWVGGQTKTYLFWRTQPHEIERGGKKDLPIENETCLISDG